jgi:hypothetical protein
MTQISAAAAAATSHAPSATPILTAAHALLPALARGSAIDAAALRTAMTAAFGGDDSNGAWDWKTAYDACEAATVLFLRQYGAAMRSRAGRPAAMLAMLQKIAALLPTHTRRSQTSQSLQQFSTPTPLAFAAACAAQITRGDVVLEPSAGTGLLAICAELAGATLALNELADARAALLSSLFPSVSVTCFDAAHIDDHLEAGVKPSVVLMNPPFTALAHVDGQVRDAGLRHIRSALARLQPGGRLTALIGANVSPDAPAWRDAFAHLQERARLVFHAAIDGALYAKHGTTMETRLIVFDKIAADDPLCFPSSPGTAPDVATLLTWIETLLPPRPPCLGAMLGTSPAPATSRSTTGPLAVHTQRHPGPDHSRPYAAELAYRTAEAPGRDHDQLSDAIYEPYRLQAIRIEGACAHPTKLVQSSAMASVAPPLPSYRPHVTPHLVSEGVLSDAQLESVIYAGEAQSGYLAGAWRVDETYDVVTPAPDDAADAVRFRRGWFLGDGTGAGKGRQVAGILLDNWLKGRRRAIWISKSDKLLEDAQRDWSALGMERLLVTPLSRFPQGAAIRLSEGILFTTYATLRSETRNGKASRVQQIVDWVGRDFDGLIVFDESHAMANAAGGKGARGDQSASQQGRAGLRLQHALANARVLYVSATGATGVQNLAYAQRLGLWGGADFPFANRAEFVEAVEAGGVAAMEVVARDLKALGLYAARSLSYEGVQYELVDHALSDAQIRIYDSYADAFQIIHGHLDAALRAIGVKSESGTVNAQAMSAARSAFESAKQRFFNHLLIGMKTPTLLNSIEGDLDAGHSAVIQIVSTGEALMSRRLADIPTEDWADVQVDITPREYVLDYLLHSFPVQLHEEFSDGEGNISTRPVERDGKPVLCREAVARRDELIAHLAALAPVPGALDQIVQHFGTDAVAEVTGRSRRIVRRGRRFAVEGRPAAANLAETAAFMEDKKRILIFSDAGGTGRSYHADLGAMNQRLRVHYLLEPGWRADAAIQGLGRTNRTNQKQPPLFRPVATNVKAEKRFLSTIARRLDSLGAITRGQRQTGGQGLFRPEDNLESQYARDALRQLYKRVAGGAIEGCSLAQFEAMTGLSLTDDNGLKDELPPITTFLNRLLALRIETQNILFSAFEDLIEARIEGAKAAGFYDTGLETLHAESFVVQDRATIYTHPASGAETKLLTIARRERNAPLTVDDALTFAADRAARLVVNTRSGRAAILARARSVMLESGEIEKRVRLVRPMEDASLTEAALAETAWGETDPAGFARAWAGELADIPPFTESTLHIVSGLILPIWKRLPEDSARVYRLQADDGERIIGRRVSSVWAAGAGAAPAPLTPEAALNALLKDNVILCLREGLELRRVRVMHAVRIELSGFTDAMRERLSAYGLFHEIIAWKLRMFVPTDQQGKEVLARLFARYPLERVSDGSSP